MIDFLRDPLWQFVGVVLALLSLASAFWIYWLQRQVKELAFGIISSRRLLAIDDDLSSRVTVQLDGKAVKSLHLLVFGLKNSGPRALASADFQKPFEIRFNAGQVISTEVASQLPPNLNPVLVPGIDSVSLQPLLLNPGDQVVIQVLLSSAKPSYEVDARIVEVASLSEINTRPRLPRFFDSGLPMMVILLALVGGVMLWFGREPTLAYMYLVSAVLIPFGSYIDRWIEKSRRTARRRISEA
jgi:hypothetical protein